MKRLDHLRRMLTSLLVAAMPAMVAAKLPPPTPAQQQAEAAKKAAAAEKAEKDKKELAASMQKIADRWRQQAQAKGWPINEPTPVAAIPGFEASAKQSGPAGQPGGQIGAAAAEAPIRSEKRATAPGSEDVKRPSPEGPDVQLAPGIYPQEGIEQQERTPPR